MRRARDFLPENDVDTIDWSSLASNMLGDVIGVIPRASMWTCLMLMLRLKVLPLRQKGIQQRH